MSEYTEYFLKRQGCQTPLECIEFAHPAFSKTYYIVRNNTFGITATHEDSTTHDYQYLPIKIDVGNTTDDLDQTLTITLADMGVELPKELDAVRLSEFADIKPTVKYRAYRHDDLSQPLVTLQLLDVNSLTRDATGLATFQAKAPELNNVKTGEIYSFDLFPMLRGFL